MGSGARYCLVGLCGSGDRWLASRKRGLDRLVEIVVRCGHNQSCIRKHVKSMLQWIRTDQLLEMPPRA